MNRAITHLHALLAAAALLISQAAIAAPETATPTPASASAIPLDELRTITLPLSRLGDTYYPCPAPQVTSFASPAVTSNLRTAVGGEYCEKMLRQMRLGLL